MTMMMRFMCVQLPDFLDESEWAAVADGGDLGIVADQGGREPPGVAGRGGARALTGVPGTPLGLCVSFGLAGSGRTSGRPSPVRYRRRGPSR